MGDSSSTEVQFNDVKVGLVSILNNEKDIRVAHCRSMIEDNFSLRTSRSRVARVYSVLAVVVRTALRKAVEDALTNTMHSALQQQLSDWVQWSFPHW